MLVGMLLRIFDAEEMTPEKTPIRGSVVKFDSHFHSVMEVDVDVCYVDGSDDSRHGESALARADDAPNWVAEHLGASSRRPRHPPDGGGTLAVYLCTRPKKTTRQRACHQPVQDNANCGTQPRHMCDSTTGMLIHVEELQSWNLMVCRTVWTMGTKLCAAKGM